MYSLNKSLTTILLQKQLSILKQTIPGFTSYYNVPHNNIGT